jgi:hypothetical protein
MDMENSKTESISISVEIDRIKQEMAGLHKIHSDDPEWAHSEFVRLMFDMLDILGHGDIGEYWEGLPNYGDYVEDRGD